MADYYAVLKRTLSGFADPQPQLREKLYERARSTIERQLKGRVPPLDDATLAAELSKLGDAIVQIEQDYTPQAASSPPQEPKPQPVREAVTQAVADPAPLQEPVQEQPVASAVEPAFAEPAPPAEAIPAAPQPEPVYQPVPPQPVIEQPAPVVADPLPELVPEPQAPAPIAEAPSQAAAVDPAEFSFDPTPEQWEAAVQATTGVNPAPPPPPAAPPAPEMAGVAAPAEPVAVDPAKELEAFLEQASTQAGAHSVPAPPPAPAAYSDPVQDPLYAPPPAATAAPTPPGAHDLPSFNEMDETLTIPPAPGYAPPARKPRRNMKPIALGVLGALLIGGVGYAGYSNRDTLLSAVGLGGDDFAKPNPVRTITITPEPASSEPEPKIDDRLTTDGDQASPAAVPQIAPQLSTDDAPQTALNTDTASEPAATTDTTDTNGGAPVVAQKAFLYEEAGAGGGNTADIGRVVWSVVQEAPVSGQPAEPAIRARVEVPERGLVLIMTLKRNADPALPASHLIDLVFAVPDTFPGGNINEINRFVMKETEQSRGDQLVAVPARIADGIFLIALNNLDQAKEANENLLKSRGWIDIPVQYRTGRRALVTIEKGVPGDAVFEEVFAAWAAQ
ncbi:MAG: hypothetical protein AAGI12_00025 [Pseudomonadota bacterium]